MTEARLVDSSLEIDLQTLIKRGLSRLELLELSELGFLGLST
jgi:hypothetical protein